MSEFQQAHEARAISFPPFANCRIMRRVRRVAAEEGGDAAGRVFVNTTVVAAAPLQMSQAPNTSYNIILEILKQCPESQDAMLAAHLSEIRACPFYGMRVEYAPEAEGGASQPARNCQLAVALVRTTQKSRCVSTASGFLVSTAGVRDAFGDEDSDTVTIHGYCSVDNLLSFKMDPPSKAKQRVCLLLITASSPEAITVHSVTHIDEATVAEAKYFIKKMRTLGMRAEPQQSGGRKRMNEWEKTPDSAKKCKVLDAHPSGESFDASQLAAHRVPQAFWLYARRTRVRLAGCHHSIDKSTIDSSVSFAHKSTIVSSASFADKSTIDSSVSFADKSAIDSSV
eukprot:191741-Lingulodinium_polyedra.AAC.1